MICKIPDDRIKKAIRDYRNGKINAYGQVVDLVSPYIYNFPRIVFNQEADICGDFYQYIIADLKSILDGYRISDVKFVTWFTVVLRNRYISFIRKSKKQQQGNQPLVYLDDDSGGVPLYVKIPDRRRYGEVESNRYDEMIERIVSNLKPGLRVFFHFYYIESLRPDDVVFLSIHLEKSPYEIIHMLGSLRDSLDEKYRIKNNLYKRISRIYEKIMDAQREKNGSQVFHYRKIREKLLEEYFRVKLNPSYQVISRVLNVPAGTVSAGIFRMKRCVKEIIGEASYDTL